MADKHYFDHGWPWYHWHFWPFVGFNNMFTQPLLFDDSLSLLQKVAMLWKKLYDLIQDYDQFKTDFAAWKTQVENALRDLSAAIEGLDNRIDGLDGAISNINQSITNINQTLQNMGDINALRQTVENLGSQVSLLTTRVTATEREIAAIADQLSRLDIRLPLQIMDSTNFDALGTNWYNWITSYCDARTGNASGTCAGIWTRTDDFHPTLQPPDHSKPRKELTVGKAGQNFTEAVLPLMLRATLTTPTTLSNEAQVVTEVMQKITASGLDTLYRKGLAAQEESYFHFAALNAYPYSDNLITFQTSYLLFQPNAWSNSELSALYSVSFDQSGTYTVRRANSIRQDVRLFMTQNSADCKLAVLGNELYFIVYNGCVVVCFHAQNA